MSRLVLSWAPIKRCPCIALSMFPVPKFLILDQLTVELHFLILFPTISLPLPLSPITILYFIFMALPNVNKSHSRSNANPDPCPKSVEIMHTSQDCKINLSHQNMCAWMNRQTDKYKNAYFLEPVHLKRPRPGILQDYSILTIDFGPQDGYVSIHNCI